MIYGHDTGDYGVNGYNRGGKMTKEEICIIGMTYHYVEMETHNNDESMILWDYEKENYEEKAPLKVHDKFPVFAKRNYIPGMIGSGLEG